MRKIAAVAILTVLVVVTFQNCAVGGESGTLSLGSNGKNSGTTTGGTTGGGTTGTSGVSCASIGGEVANGKCYRQQEECMQPASISGPYTYPKSAAWVSQATTAGLTGCTDSESLATVCRNCCTSTAFPFEGNPLNKLRPYCTGNFY